MRTSMNVHICTCAAAARADVRRRRINQIHRSSRQPTSDFANGRDKRDVWTVNSEATPEAYFATFRQKLFEPCILAGTSEKGCCAECGAPRVRATEKARRLPQSIVTGSRIETVAWRTLDTERLEELYASLQPLVLKGSPRALEVGAAGIANPLMLKLKLSGQSRNHLLGV